MSRISNWCICVFLIIAFDISLIGQFKNVSIEAGLISTHRSGALMGGGGAMVDIDGDGWLDIVLTGGRNIDKLFFNNRDGTFRPEHNRLPQNAGGLGNERSAVVYGDLNNDECVDLVFTTFVKSERSFVLEGNCDGSFSLTEIASSEGPSIGTTLLDFDLDGLLDIYIINYIDEASILQDSTGTPIGFDHSCFPNKLFKNKGDFIFEEVTDTLKVGGKGCALAVLGYYDPVQNFAPTFYIANDFGEWIQPNEMFQLNNSQDSFIDQAPLNMSDEALYGMGIALGDPTLDGQLDLMVTNIGQSAFLEGDAAFYNEKALELGVVDERTNTGEKSTGWGVNYSDLDNDGDEDIVIAKGYIPAAPFLEVANSDSCRIFLNNEGVFREASSLLEGPTTYFNRGVICGDIDNDGDQDILFTTVSIHDDGEEEESNVQLLINEMTVVGNYLNIDLSSNITNYSAIGSILKCFTGGINQTRVVYVGGTHASHNSNKIHFGVGESEIIDSLEIRWPDGEFEKHYNIPSNQTIGIFQGVSTFVIKGCMDATSSYFNTAANFPTACPAFETQVATIERNPFRIQGYFSNDIKSYVLNNLPTHTQRIRIFDLLGREFRDFNSSGKSEIRIDLKDLNNGVYVVNIYTALNELIFTDKILVAR